MFAVGYVHRHHGLDGEVSVEKIADSEGLFDEGGELVWVRGEQRRGLTITSSRTHGDRWLLSFEGIRDADSARELAGGALCLESLPPQAADFYWSHDVRGWTCEDRAGRELGKVRDLSETAAGPQLTLDTAEGREILVPFVRPIVVEVDGKGRRIVLDPPEGLMEL